MTTLANVPAFGELPSANKTSLRDIVIRIVSRPDVFIEILPYFHNGGICGHKVMDLKASVDIIRAADKDGELAPYSKTDCELGNILKNVLRSRYTLDKKWKIDGLNPKVAAMLPRAQTDSDETPASE